LKSKITKILGVVLSLALLSSLAVIAVPVSAAGSATVVNKWEALGLPSTLVGSDVEIITQAEDGTLYISVAEYSTGKLTVTSGAFSMTETGGLGKAANVTDLSFAGTWAGLVVAFTLFLSVALLPVWVLTSPVH